MQRTSPNTAFRLSSADKRALTFVARQLHMSQSEVFRVLVRGAAERLKADAQQAISQGTGISASTPTEISA